MQILETERLILRPWRESDLADFYEYSKNPNVGPNAGWKPHECMAESEAILLDFIKRQEVWAVEYKKEGKPIGSLGLHKDGKRDADVKAKMLGYAFGESHWGMGLCTEAARRAIRYVFEETDAQILSVYHYPFNQRSRRVIEKCGFTLEGTLRMGSVLYDGRVYDDCCYSMLKSEYERMVGQCHAR